MKMTVYLPDDLAAEVKAELSGDTNISAIFQQALRDELTRARAHAAIDAQGYQRIEAMSAGREVAFQGRWIGDYLGVFAYLTPKGKIVVAGGRDWTRFSVYSDFASFAAASSPDLASNVAVSLGEKYVRELDI
jgi:hypothetical protein